MSLSTRGHTKDARRTTILQKLESKSHHKKLIREGYDPDEGKDKTPGKQVNEVEMGNIPEKSIQNNDSEEDPASCKKNGEDE